jgi:hypothetical protein
MTIPRGIAAWFINRTLEGSFTLLIYSHLVARVSLT